MTHLDQLPWNKAKNRACYSDNKLMQQQLSEIIASTKIANKQDFVRGCENVILRSGINWKRGFF